MENFNLKDYIRHKAYNFPRTLVKFKFSDNAPDLYRDVLFMDGKAIPYQTEKAEDGYFLKVITDLPCGGSHEFVWGKGENDYDVLDGDNGILIVKSVSGGLFDVITVGGRKFSYTLETENKILKISEEKILGQVESVYSKIFVFGNGGEYRFTLKLKRDLEYLEIYEEASGIKRGEVGLNITWKEFYPTCRYTADRKEEKIDAYVDENGKFPFVINPFMPKTSWWDQRSVAYFDKSFSFWSGILLHDLENYDDGTFSIWGSTDELAFFPYTDCIKGYVSNGKRAFVHIFSDKPVSSLTEYYMRYYSIVSLDKVKDYVLKWDDDKNEYPKYFSVEENTVWNGFYHKHVGKPPIEEIINILDRDATIFTEPENIAPVSCRAYRTSWAQVFDLTARYLKDEDFDRIRAAMALICYTLSSENYYPTKNLLAGHPNFLTDVAGTVAVFASVLGKRHPAYKQWMNYYETVLAMNFKYHCRPDVPAWGSFGGRWTENVGAYMMTMLRAVVYDCHIIYTLDKGEMPALYSHIKNFIHFLVGIQTPENIERNRLYPRIGSHACNGAYGGKYGHGYALYMVQLAEMLKYYDPMYSEYIMHNFCKNGDIEKVLKDADIYGDTYKKHMGLLSGTSPDLKSVKYTGFGYVLRDKVNTAEEMCVYLQQIDEGPNYRWGRAAEGGCGEIYYYASGRKYSDHMPEDVGDENRGDVQSCTNFGVLVGHEFKSVGRSDLTEPLIDFDFVKYARVNASEYSYPYYKYRSVLMVENKYIVVYDRVGDAKQFGRFSWAQNGTDPFPLIKNLRPGKEAVVVESGVPIDKDSGYKSKYGESKVLNIDGEGDFLTVVTHLRNYHDEKQLLSIETKDYGASVVFPQATDRVFDDGSLISVSERDYGFVGYVGYMTELHDETRMAVIDGKSVRVKDTEICISYDKGIRRSISLVFSDNYLKGKLFFGEEGEIRIVSVFKGEPFIDGEKVKYDYKEGTYRFKAGKGYHAYNIGNRPALKQVEILNVINTDCGATVVWDRVPGAEEYKIYISDNNEYSFTDYSTVRGENSTETQITGLKKGKYHVRVCAVNVEEVGQSSHSYPVYIDDRRPHCPEGFRVEIGDKGFIASWGKVLGCDRYRLYKTDDGNKTLVYDGAEISAEVDGGSYCVSAVNGIGESECSPIRSSSDPVAKWDNHRELGFIRDTRSFEHGYTGFDFINNKQKKILKYPEGETDKKDV